jgi:hypothetical protein
MAGASDPEAAHRFFAVELNNLAWSLLEGGHEGEPDPFLLLDAAHAAAYHWRRVGNDLNVLRAATLLTTAYVHLDWAETATRHAERTHALLRSLPDGATPFDAAAGFAAVSRAFELDGRHDEAAASRAAALARARDMTTDGVSLIQRLYELAP